MKKIKINKELILEMMGGGQPMTSAGSPIAPIGGQPPLYIKQKYPEETIKRKKHARSTNMQ